MKIEDLGNGILKKVDKSTASQEEYLVDRVSFLEYKIDFQGNDYQKFLYDSFVGLEYVSDYTADYNLTKKSFTSSSSSETNIVTTNFSVESTQTFKVNLDVDSSIDNSLEKIEVEMSTDNGESWGYIELDKDIKLVNSFNNIQLKITLPAEEDIVLKSYVVYLDYIENKIVNNDLADRVIKNSVEGKYKPVFYHSQYNNLLIEDLVNPYIDTDKTTALFQQGDFKYTLHNDSTEDEIITKVYKLDNPTKELEVLFDSELPEGIKIKASNDGGQSFLDALEGVVTFTAEGTDIVVKFIMSRNTTDDPEPMLYDFCIMV